MFPVCKTRCTVRTAGGVAPTLLSISCLMVGCTPEEDAAFSIETGRDAAEPLPGGSCSAEATLKQRPAEALTLTDAVLESEDADQWQLVRRGQYVTLRGQGYLNLRWQIEYRTKAGLITPPIFSVLSGSFFRVGGGGGKNLGDPQPGTSGTYMGNEEEGLSYMPETVPTPWQNEFYYLDGEVKIELNETDGLYNIVVSPQSYAQVVSPDWGVYEPGEVCDPA